MNAIAHDFLTNEQNTERKANYGFIETHFPELYQVCEQIDYYYTKDHSCCLVKVRLFLELWCHEVGEKIKLRPPVRGELINKIKQIEASGKVPPYVIDMLDTLRAESNKGVHIQRHIDGQFRADILISKYKLKGMMEDVFELTKYLVLNVAGISEQPLDTWTEPEVSEQAELVHQALQGNADASIAIAMHFSGLLKKLDQQTTASKPHYFQYQRDLEYWLDKAERQGSNDCWLLYATSCVNKHLLNLSSEDADDYFKKAIETDESGEAEWEFYLYLCRIGQHSRGQAYLNSAGEKGHQEALHCLLAQYYKQDELAFNKWLNRSLEVADKKALTTDAFNKLDLWEEDTANELNLRKLRTALIKAEAYQAPGVQFIRGYCEYHGLLNCEQNQDSGTRKMLEGSAQLPEYLWYEKRLYDALKLDQSNYHKALDLYPAALQQTENVIEKAQMKFDAAMIIVELLKNANKVKTPQNLKVLIRESAKEGCEQAKQFLASPSGKALMRDSSYVCQKVKRKAVDRTKQKKARKQAKSARRK
ncbi:DUF4145 domain-containing protein [Photobacterium sp. J15]|uniref:DUF4145 domain-containing protein n=1 Tax=Photobacterium sp. J15 TaxID=265901 RepID=UPI0007E3F7C3|nr:DUF4145 domain-containing protein [Photobacterium sp. J15]